MVVVARTPSPPLSARAVSLVRLWIDLFARHQLLNSASAISFQTLKALVPLALFGVALLGAIGLPEVWDTQISESVFHQLRPTAFAAIDDAVQRILSEEGAALLIFAGALLLWYVSGAVRACMGGMNVIYEADDDRSWRRRWGVSFALAVGIAVAVVVAAGGFAAGPRIAGNGWIHVVLLVVRWPFAAVALGLAVGLLVHYGAAERRQARWASLGALLIVAAWMVETLLFGWYVTSFADFKSASGALTAFLVLAAYLYTASIIFLVGVELDELLRKDASRGERGIIDRLRGRIHAPEPNRLDPPGRGGTGPRDAASGSS